MHKQAILFDFDGVIIDSTDELNRFWKQTGGAGNNVELYELCKGNFYQTSTDQTGITHSKEQDERWAQERNVMQKNVPYIIGMPELITKLSSSYAIFIISSSHSDTIISHLEKHDLLPHITQILGCDAERSKLKKIEMVLGQGLTSTNCIFITDTLGDVREASERKISSIGVTWGLHTPETLQEDGKIPIANTVAELEDLIAANFS